MSKYRELLKRIENLEKQLGQDIGDTEKYIDTQIEQSINMHRWRWYLIETNFVGILKNKKLKDEWHRSFWEFYYGPKIKYNFSEFKKDVETFNIFDNYYDFRVPMSRLSELEDKQKLLDEYVEKTPKATPAPKGSSNIKNKKENKK